MSDIAIRSARTMCRVYPENGVEEGSMLAAQLAVSAAFKASSHWSGNGEEKLADEITTQTLEHPRSEGSKATIILSIGLKENLGELFPGISREDVFRVTIKHFAHCVAMCGQKSIYDVVCVVLNRTRNQDLINRLSEIGVQVILISDIDPKSTLMLEEKEKPVDFAFGISVPAKDQAK